MSMSQKEIKDVIAENEARYRELQDGYKNISEYRHLQEEIDDLNKKKTEAERRQAEIRLDYRDEVKDDINLAVEDLKYTRELLRKNKDGLDYREYNDDLIKMFKAFYSGSTYSYEKKLMWVSDNGEYAIFKIPSHSAYIDRMSGSVNSGAEWSLFRIDPDFDETRLELRSELCIWHKEGGRWGAKRDMKIIEDVIKNYETNYFMSQFMENNGFKLIVTHHSMPEWVNEDIVIKYQTTKTHQMGFDKGKTTVEDHERVLRLRIDNNYYHKMPTNEKEFSEKYEEFYKELIENR